MTEEGSAVTNSCPDGPKRNKRFPYCAEAARKLLCEAYGLKFGDKIPPADDLLTEARRLAALKWDEVDGDPSNNLKRWDSARAALAILDEIGGLFEPAAGERLADIEDSANCAEDVFEPGYPVADVRWLIERVRVLAAERDDLIVERDKWKTRVTG